MEAERTHTKLQTLDADAPEGDEAGERKGIGSHESATTAHECTPRWALTELGAHETRVYHGQIRHQVSCHIQEIAENGAALAAPGADPHRLCIRVAGVAVAARVGDQVDAAEW